LFRVEGGSVVNVESNFAYGVINQTTDNYSTALKLRFIDNTLMVWDIDNNDYKAFRGSYPVTTDFNDGNGGTYHKVGMAFGDLFGGGLDSTAFWKIDKFEVKMLSSAATLAAATKSYVDAGNFGVGITNPTSKFHVVGDARIQGNLTVNGTYTQIDTDVNTTEQWLVTNDGTGPAAVINQKGSEDIFDVQDDGTSVFYIEDGGQIGIGTTSPTARLHVESADDVVVRLKSTDNKAYIALSDNDTNGYISSENGKLSLGANTGVNANNLNIDLSNSNVGIGTSSPSEKLEVTGYAKASTGFKAGNYTILNESGNETSLGNSAYYPMFFKTNNSVRMTISNAGSVGIGTTSPSEKLHVVGDLKIQTNADAGVIHFGDTSDETKIVGYDSSDSNTRFDFFTSGSKKLTILDSGNVGIGTDSPSANLEIGSDGAGEKTLKIHSDTANSYFEIESLGNIARLKATNNTNLMLRSDGGGGYITNWTNGAERMRITSAGNVGIGINNPAYVLDTHSGTTNVAARFKSGDNQAWISVQDDDSGTYGALFGTDSDAGHDIILADSSANKRLVINGSGHVGIGTTSPDSLLHVSADVSSGGVTNTGTITIEGRPAGYLGDDIATIDFHNTGVKYADIRMERGNAANDSQLVFSTSDTGTLNDALIINEVGNVGIGTTTPSEKLEVNGNIKVGDGNEARFGADNDLRIYHNGTNSNIENFTGTLQIVQTVDDDDITFRCDDGSGGTTPYLTIDGSAVANKFSEKVQIYKVDATANPRLSLGRQAEESINFDVEDRTARIYHRQDETTGNHVLKLTVDSDTSDTKDIHLGFRDADGSNESIKFTVDESGNVGVGTTDPSEKLHVAGNIKVADNNELRVGTGNDLRFTHTGTGSYIDNYTGNLSIRNFADDSDILFQSDDGSGGVETYFFLDGGSVATQFNKNTLHPDGVKARFGSSADMYINHDGTNSYIENETGNLYILNRSDDKDIVLQSDDGSGGLATYLQLDGSSVRTRAFKDVNFDDSVQATFGASSDLKIYHDGSNSYIKDGGTGNLRIAGQSVDILNPDANEFKARFKDNAEVELYYDNSKKFETTSTGVEVTGNISLTGSVQKQIQVFPMNFVDDLGTDKHFMPFVTNTEQTVNYQEEAAMVMPADGRVVSVTVHYAQMHGAASDITVGIETSPCGQSYTNAWTIEETETISASADDDHHVFHFAFDNAKHFESTDKMALSIQQSVDLQNANRFFWVTAVIEYDWSTFLGGTSAEYTTTP
jgi:hypothetical protein